MTNRLKYFFDTEFSERAGERPTIDLISIGIVCEDGREYYAESSEFLDRLCNPWVKENVLPLLGPEEERKSKETIRDEVLAFIQAPGGHRLRIYPEFWAYFADYDWVVFCWLFGAMADLPQHFPKYCRDLQQEADRLGLKASQRPPKPNKEHNALADARWNMELWEVLEQKDALITNTAQILERLYLDSSPSAKKLRKELMKWNVGNE